MLRLTSSAAKLSAFGFSAVVHAGALFVSVGPSGHSSAPGQADALVVDVQTELAAPEPEPVPTVTPAVGRATTWPAHTHPYPVPADHDSTPHDPNLVHVAAHVPAPVAAAMPAETAADDTPRFTIALGPAPGESHGDVSPVGTAAPHVHADAVFAEGTVDTPARLVRGIAPSYPAAARADGVQGDVGLELVVGDAGTVETARVARGVGRGLDEAALEAVRQFRFAPATKDGHPVRVRMGWSMQFRLQ